MIKAIKRKIYVALSERLRLEAWPPGHYYSVIPDFERAANERPACGYDSSLLQTLDLNPASMRTEILKLIDRSEMLRGFLRRPELTFDTDNEFFSRLDALYLIGMVDTYRPKQIIELGGGHTTDLFLDCLDYFDLKATRLTTIEPFPDRLAGASNHPQMKLLPVNAENADLALFETLEAGDILFIDSSHVVKSGSDVLHIFTKILPRLSSGVLVHFHDIYLPDDYPVSWFAERRAWNESYFLQTFLMYNNAFKIIFAAHFAGVSGAAELAVLTEKTGVSCVGGGSFWLQRVG